MKSKFLFFVFVLYCSFLFSVKYDVSEEVLKQGFNSLMTSMDWYKRDFGQVLLLSLQDKPLELFSVLGKTACFCRRLSKPYRLNEMSYYVQQEHVILCVDNFSNLRKIKFTEGTGEVLYSCCDTERIIDFCCKKNVIACSICGKGVCIFDAETGHLKKSIECKSGVGCLSWNCLESNDYLLAVELDDVLEIWKFKNDFSHYDCIMKVGLSEGFVLEVKWHPFDENVISVLMENKIFVFVVDFKKNEFLEYKKSFDQDKCSSIDWHPAYKNEIAIAVEKRIVVWNYKTRRVIQTMKQDDYVHRLRWNPYAEKTYSMAVVLPWMVKLLFLKK